MNLTKNAKDHRLFISLELADKGIIAEIPTRVDVLEKFGLISDKCSYNITKTLILSKEDLLKLINDMYDEFYGQTSKS